MQYEIRIEGHLSPRWVAWFDGLSDQAALHGLLQKLRDVGLPLISVTPVDPDPGHGPTIPGGN